jgi:hypothetical protein
MKILCICYDDFANFMYDNVQAMRCAGMEVESCKLKSHAFGYANQVEVVDEQTMASRLRVADLVIIYHSKRSVLDLFLNNARPQQAKLIVFHTGTPYRMDPEGMNAAYNPIVQLTLTDQCEFMHLGAKNIQYVATAIDKIDFDAKMEANVPYKIAHYPSSGDVKGTDYINEMMVKLLDKNLYHRYKYYWSKDRVNHAENLQRMKLCDIYIELFALQQNIGGNILQYGCYGVSAFEAAAMGKIVVTQNVFPAVYEKAYGCELPFILTHSENDFINKLGSLVQESNVQIRKRQSDTKEWVEKNHSYRATGEYMKKIILSVE